jgi:hypothetical protein
MTTKKRHLLIASVPLVTIAVILGVLAMLPPRPGVTTVNYDRIERGMTRAEVEEIFGREGRPFAKDGDTVFLDWREDDGSGAVIGFSHDCVVFKRWFDSNESYLDKIQRWLHLR